MSKRKIAPLRPDDVPSRKQPEPAQRPVPEDDWAADAEDADPPARLLTRSEKREIVTLMRLGAPPLLSFQKVGVTFEDVMLTADEDIRFYSQLQQVHDVLATNVNSAMYKAAMNGSVTAQTQFLRRSKQQPLPEEDHQRRIDSRKLKRLIVRATDQWRKELGIEEEE